MSSYNATVSTSRRLATLVDGIVYVDEMQATDIQLVQEAFRGQTFVDGDTTPDVSTGFVFQTANTAATSITGFDNALYDGHAITVFFSDGNTTLVNSASLSLQGGMDITPSAGDVLVFITWGGVWYGWIARTT